MHVLIIINLLIWMLIGLWILRRMWRHSAEERAGCRGITAAGRTCPVGGAVIAGHRRVAAASRASATGARRCWSCYNKSSDHAGSGDGTRYHAVSTHPERPGHQRPARRPPAPQLVPT